MTIVGLPDAAVQESRERVQAAVKNAGLGFPRKRVIVNLAPASVRKEGPYYDLPIALGVLVHIGALKPSDVEGTLVVGELSLDGAVRHVRGVLPMAAVARREGFKRMVVPEADAAEAALIPNLEVIPVPSLAGLYRHLSGIQTIKPAPPVTADKAAITVITDFAEIKGQEHVKRALEVAAAGGHNVIMMGSPGAGKTLLARALPGILPVIVLVTLLRLGHVLEAGFNQIFVLYSVPVYSVGDIIDTWVFRQGVLQFQFSLATAVGFFKGAIGLVLIVVSNRIAKRWAQQSIY
jgi:magnesium chelatase family protein